MIYGRGGALMCCGSYGASDSERLADSMLKCRAPELTIMGLLGFGHEHQDVTDLCSDVRIVLC